MSEAPEYLKVEFGYATATEIGDLFRALAVTCLEKRVLRVLLIAGDDDAAGERALRDAATTMVLAGISTRFRLALVASSSRVASAYRNTQRDLNAAGVRTRTFNNEDDALRWLDVAATDSRRAAQGAQPDLPSIM